MQLQPVRGTKDILPDDHLIYLELMIKARQVIGNYGYQEIAIPIFEFSEVFKRTLGDYSDIVTKEMYSFQDRSGQSLTLRPEHTAGIARCVISNGMQHLMPLKLFTIGPVFRYERPQKARMRQFSQLSVEAIGFDSSMIDVEIVALGAHILQALNILDKTKLEINTLGDNQSRINYLEKFTSYIAKYRDELSEDSKIRLEKNPLRILDSKDSGDQKLVAGAPVIYDSINKESKHFFDQILDGLTKIGVKFVINNKIVRGLDYYCHTVFEFITDELGSQGAVLAGGRYDTLYKLMGNYNISAVGFASGLERLFELYIKTNQTPTKPRGICVVSLDLAYDIEALKITQALRAQNKLADIEPSNNITKAIKKAVSKNSKFVIIIGEDEVRTQKFRLKDLDTRSEECLYLEELLSFVEKNEF